MDKKKRRTLDKKWGVLHSNTILCYKSKRFENLIVCSINCHNRCELYKQFFSIEMLNDYILQHPEYEIIGEIMAQTKATTPKNNSSKPKEKLFWVITETSFEEVTESELINNPVNYLGKVIHEKPKEDFELVVTLKKKTVKP